MTDYNKLLGYRRIRPPSERLTRTDVAFVYLLGFGSLLMFAIGFFGLPIPWLIRLFG